jgi:hypothetical protein
VLRGTVGAGRDRTTGLGQALWHCEGLRCVNAWLRVELGGEQAHEERNPTGGEKRRRGPSLCNCTCVCIVYETLNGIMKEGSVGTQAHSPLGYIVVWVGECVWALCMLCVRAPGMH